MGMSLDCRLPVLQGLLVLQLVTNNIGCCKEVEVEVTPR